MELVQCCGEKRAIKTAELSTSRTEALVRWRANECERVINEKYLSKNL
jgi:hypothetical protein